MKKLFAKIKCFFGFHLPPRIMIRIVDVRRESHAIDYEHYWECPRCKREVENEEYQK